MNLGSKLKVFMVITDYGQLEIRFIVPRIRIRIADISITVVGHKWWIVLPNDIKVCTNTSMFRNKLKTHIYTYSVRCKRRNLVPMFLLLCGDGHPCPGLIGSQFASRSDFKCFDKK